MEEVQVNNHTILELFVDVVTDESNVRHEFYKQLNIPPKDLKENLCKGVELGIVFENSSSLEDKDYRIRCKRKRFVQKDYSDTHESVLDDARRINYVNRMVYEDYWIYREDLAGWLDYMKDDYESEIKSLNSFWTRKKKKKEILDKLEKEYDSKVKALHAKIDKYVEEHWDLEKRAEEKQKTLEEYENFVKDLETFGWEQIR